MKYGFVIDHRKCIGCHACTVACKAENKVPLGAFRTWVKYIEKGAFPNTQRHFAVLRCNHCDNAPCVKICPVTALFRRRDGIVDFDGSRCIGCKACMQACPYDALYINPETNTAEKCNYCAHRVEVGLQPACVIVCPEQAIIAGDMDDPSSQISQLVAREEVQVRKSQKGTDPKLYYIEVDANALTPSRLSREEAYMWAESAGQPVSEQAFEEAESRAARTVYDVAHDRPWGWKVSAYLWTKSISAGVFLIAALMLGFAVSPAEPVLEQTAPALSLVFLTITGLLLIADLKRPDRFYRILTRPQWGSWLVIGGYIIAAYGALLAVWLLVDWIGWSGVKSVLLWPGAVLAVLTAIYSGFLFGQAVGRDFWQSSTTPIHLLIQAVIAGAAVLIMIVLMTDATSVPLELLSNILLGGLLANLLIILVGELSMPHASADANAARHLIVRGALSRPFWGVAILLGNIVPLLLLTMMDGMAGIVALAAVLSLIGLLAYEHIWIVAGQAVPLS
jgi:Fe-S-cluster-containing dehydrogenase component/formate-dependent nitrite reductase membrane component NrfD